MKIYYILFLCLSMCTTNAPQQEISTLLIGSWKEYKALNADGTNIDSWTGKPYELNVIFIFNEKNTGSGQIKDYEPDIFTYKLKDSILDIGNGTYYYKILSISEKELIMVNTDPKFPMPPITTYYKRID